MPRLRPDSRLAPPMPADGRAEFAAQRRSAMLGLFARLGALPLVAGAALGASHVVVAERGVAAFGLYALISTLPALLPFGDLGFGVALIDPAAAHLVRPTSALERAIRRSVVSTTRVAVGVTVVAVLVGLLGGWHRLLDTAPGTDLGATVAVALTAIAMIPNLGTRLLQAADRNHTAILVHASAGALAWAAVAALAPVHSIPVAAIATLPAAATLLAGLCCTRIAMRTYGEPLATFLPSVSGRPPHPRRFWREALPAAIITVVVPIAYLSDRLVISHVLDLTAVAIYSACAQFYNPLFVAVSSAGSSLWGGFARQRARGVGVGRTHLRALSATFAVGGVVAVLVFVLAVEVAGAWVVGRTEIPIALTLAFAAYLFFQVLTQPAAMMLTDRAGLRFQAGTGLLLVAVNVPLSVGLCLTVGVSGPVWASALTQIVIVTVPQFLRARARSVDRIAGVAGVAP